MRVIWTPEAQQDRTDVWDYIATDNPRAAVQMDELFSDAAAKLANHPMLERSGKIPGTRELIPHESYRLVYGLYCNNQLKALPSSIREMRNNFMLTKGVFPRLKYYS